MTLIQKIAIIIPFFWTFGEVYAQAPKHFPLRIEERIDVVKEVSSKYGTKLKKKTNIIITYNDSSTEIVTHRKMNELVAYVPLAQYEWKKYNANRVYEVSSIPLFAIGFWGAYNLTQGENQSRNALLTAVGLGGGYLLFEYFDWQKKRNMKKIMALCNNYWSHKDDNKIENFLKPDAIRLGFINQNSLGVGLCWQISD